MYVLCTDLPSFFERCWLHLVQLILLIGLQLYLLIFWLLYLLWAEHSKLVEMLEKLASILNCQIWSYEMVSIQPQVQSVAVSIHSPLHRYNVLLVCMLLGQPLEKLLKFIVSFLLVLNIVILAFNVGGLVSSPFCLCAGTILMSAFKALWSSRFTPRCVSFGAFLVQTFQTTHYSSQFQVNVNLHLSFHAESTVIQSWWQPIKPYISLPKRYWICHRKHWRSSQS